MPRAARPTPEARRAFVDEMKRRLEAIPGVTSVGFTSQLPLTGSGALQPYAYDEATARNWESATSDRRTVSPDYFLAMGTRVLAGRVFDAHDLTGCGRTRSSSTKRWPREPGPVSRRSASASRSTPPAATATSTPRSSASSSTCGSST